MPTFFFWENYIPTILKLRIVRVTEIKVFKAFHDTREKSNILYMFLCVFKLI